MGNKLSRPILFSDTAININKNNQPSDIEQLADATTEESLRYAGDLEDYKSSLFSLFSISSLYHSSRSPS